MALAPALSDCRRASGAIGGTGSSCTGISVVSQGKVCIKAAWLMADTLSMTQRSATKVAGQDSPATGVDVAVPFEAYAVCKRQHTFSIVIAGRSSSVKVICPECGRLCEIPEDAVDVARTYLMSVQAMGEEAVLRALNELEKGH